MKGYVAKIYGKDGAWEVSGLALCTDKAVGEAWSTRNEGCIWSHGGKPFGKANEFIPCNLTDKAVKCLEKREVIWVSHCEAGEYYD